MRLDLVFVRMLCAMSFALAAPAWAQPAASSYPESPSSGQPNLPPGAAPRPAAVPYAPAKPGSPVVQQLVGGGSAPLLVRKHMARAHRRPRHRVARRLLGPVVELERPALAGVTLLQPLPRPRVPHIVVPLPAYPLESVADALMSAPPPIVCHRTAPIRDLPDPHLLREETLDCEPDTP